MQCSMRIPEHRLLFVALAASVLACGTRQTANTSGGTADVATGDMATADTDSTPDSFLPPDGGPECEAVNCDDLNVCTNDWCEAGACKHQDNTSPCDDANGCTAGDTCNAGACSPGAGSGCADDNLCTDDSCDTGANACVHTPNSVSCTDGKPCTLDDICNKGACVPGMGKDCDDKNACTDDTCNADTGDCQHAPKPGCVAALKPCTKTSECDAGVCDLDRHVCVPCVASADCGSGYTCSKQQCVGSKACTSGADCKGQNQVCGKTDGVCVDCVTVDDCGADELCVQSVCVSAPKCKSDKDCSGVCDTGKGVCVGCVATADCKAGTWCAPWQECVAVACSGQACLETTVFGCLADGSGYAPGEVCMDNIGCTEDQCDPSKGCTFLPNDDVCQDSNPCSEPICDAIKGCLPVAVADGQACGVGNKCQAGYCIVPFPPECGDMSGLQKGAPWPMLGACPTHQGRSPYVGAQTNKLKWKVLADKPAQGMYSSPVVAVDGTIYLGAECHLLAVSATGQQEWKVAPAGCGMNKGMVSTPTISADGSIYIVSLEGSLYNIDANGAVKWTFQIGSLVESSPTVGAGDTIYVWTEESHLLAVGPSGQQKWDLAMPVPNGWAANGTGTSPAVGTDGTVYVAGANQQFDLLGYVSAVNTNGKLGWTYKMSEGIGSDPAIGAGGTIYFGGGNSLCAVSSSGEEKWKFTVPGWQSSWSSPALGADGTVFSANMDYLYAITSSGQEKWKFKMGGWVTGSVAIGADGTVYVGSNDGYLYAVSSGGNEKWKFKTDGPIHSSPAIGADGTVYLTSTDGYLYAIGL